ncbi:MAG: peptidoglycan DD-metalloendopeptidase family protein [Clostridia bacterium]|nr:peptidoglycan DD-metalloendopeptidase family protein [Clostridia bacterium]
MKTRTNLIRRRLSVASILLIVAMVFSMMSLLTSSATFAGSEEDSKVQDYENEINALEKQASTIKKRLNETKSDIKATEEQLKDLAELRSITEQRIKLSQDLVAELETEQAELNETITAQEAKIETTFQQFLKRMAASYEDGTISYLEMLFNSDSLISFLSKWDYVSALLSHDKKLVAQYRTEKEQLEERKLALEISLNKQLSLQSSLALLQEEMDVMEKDAEEALAELKARYQNQNQEYHQFREQIDEINKELEAYLEELAKQSQNQFSDEGLIWPLPGYRYISSYYGNRSYMYQGRKITDFHTGIDITGSSVYGKPIVAAASGTVIRAEYHKSYGNYLIIDHGGGIVTLYAHCSSLKVQKGDTVSQGDIVALVGSTGQSTGAHLHFEVRVNGKHVDPIGSGYVVQPGK